MFSDERSRWAMWTVCLDKARRGLGEVRDRPLGVIVNTRPGRQAPVPGWLVPPGARCGLIAARYEKKTLRRSAEPGAPNMHHGAGRRTAAGKVISLAGKQGCMPAAQREDPKYLGLAAGDMKEQWGNLRKVRHTVCSSQQDVQMWRRRRASGKQSPKR